MSSSRQRPVAEEPFRTKPYPRVLLAVAMVVALGLLLPIAFLVLQVVNVGWGAIAHFIFRQRVGFLLWNTVRLTVAVTAFCATIGVATAFLVERTEIPCRRLIAVLVVLPLAIPDFVVGYAWSSLSSSINGYFAATLVMTLSLYPLVYLPVAASLRRSDAAQYEVAQSLGLTRWSIFFRVTVPQIRLAVFGGCLVVSLAMLAEYGAFEILRFQTFTTEIFTEFNVGFDPAAASALAVVLVLLGAVVLTGEYFAGGKRRSVRSSGARRVLPRLVLGRGRVPALIGVAVLIAAALGVPIATLGYWLIVGSSTTLPSASILSALGYTVLYAGFAAAIATVLAIPIALLIVRHRGPVAIIMERCSFISQALPGLVIALALIFFSIRYFLPFYESGEELVAGYVALFFPLALVGVRAAVAQAPPQLEEVARSLGKTPVRAWMSVTLPIVAPGLAAAFSLVFLSAVTELTATLLLRPTGVATLATQFWSYETNLAYGAAAPYAALIVGIAAVPTYLLGRWFDARPRQDEVVVIEGAELLR